MKPNLNIAYDLVPEGFVQKAVNWNEPDTPYVLPFWEQNVKQFWIDTEFIPANDLDSYRKMTEKMKDTYIKVLGGLTLLDTVQNNDGMPMIARHQKSHQVRTILSFMGMMEGIHAKSYSTIFTTIASKDEIDSVFAWVQTSHHLQEKARIIKTYYLNIDGDESPQPEHLYMAMVASIFLESFLFYSGFFLPLYLAGHGEMRACGDIIKKILQDENVHGLFVGLLAQDVLKTISPEKQELLAIEVDMLLEKLMENEISYTEELYEPLDLAEEVADFLRYNANKALQNLGLTEKYPNTEINPVVMNGLSLETTQHDFFSTKGTNYEVSLEVVQLEDEDFDIDKIFGGIEDE